MMMILKYPKNHQNHDFWDDVFDVDFVDDSFDVFVDGLQDALPSPYNVKLARYGLLTIQTGTLRSPYNSNWRVTVSLQFKLARYGLVTIFQTGLRHFYEWILPFCLRRPQAPPEPDLVLILGRIFTYFALAREHLR